MELVCKSRTERRPSFTRKHPRLARAGSNGWPRCSTDPRLSQSQPNSLDSLKCRPNFCLEAVTELWQDLIVSHPCRQQVCLRSPEKYFFHWRLCSASHCIVTGGALCPDGKQRRSSDLYSLSVVLWKMVTGHAVFRGSPAEVMYQHQHAPLPYEELEHVPQPVVVPVLRTPPHRLSQSSSGSANLLTLPAASGP